MAVDNSGGAEEILDETLSVEEAVALAESKDLAADSDEPYQPVTFEILYRDKDMIAIEKPNTFHVHRPEDRRCKVPRDKIVLHNLRDQINEYLFPVHRLDAGTEGVLLFALNKEMARGLAQNFQKGLMHKTYFAIVRGWPDDEGVIDIPLELDSTNIPVPALSRYRTLQKVELPFAIGKRHQTSRYALVEVKPETGRFHQIRRHMARLSHPLVGDSMHGDSHHNRFFRTQLDAAGLWLKAKEIEFIHPITGENTKIVSAWSPRWLKTFETLGLEIPR